MDEQYSLYAILSMLAYKSLSASERNKADAYAGPGKSFPLYKNGEHLRAAWDLAGHADDPAAVRAKVRAFAEAHGLTHHLPADAMAQKARNEDVADLLRLAYAHETSEGDKPQQARLAHWAKQHGYTHLLPADAHGVMHDEGIVHEHDDVPNDEYGQHVHAVVKKAFSSLVGKAHLDSGDTVIEGWISTPDPDLDKDVVEPEAFLTAMDTYAAVGMPLSSDHDTSGYPVGHGQRVAVVRDGKVLKSATHPDDGTQEFEYFPNSGTGVYGRFVITEPKAANAVFKGNVRGFSWIGKPVVTEPLPTGGKRMTKVEPWLESTIAAYPVNQRARVLAAQ